MRTSVASLLALSLSFAFLGHPESALAEAKKKASSANKSTAKKDTTAKVEKPAATAKPATTPTPEKSAPAEETGGNAGNALKDALGAKSSSGGAPLYIKSDTLSLDSKGRIFTYRNNVQVQRDDLLITADTVEGRYDDSNQIQNVLATGNVVITKGDGLKATSNRAIYYVPQAKIELTEAPELYRGGNALAADKVTIFVNEDRSEAEGNVRVKVLKDAASGAPSPAGG